jgi:uncharacterized protein (TIGR02231 family)
MNRLLYFALLFAVSIAWADEVKNVNSELKTVTVFLSGAQEYRNVKTSISAGNTNIVIKGLSQHINPSSIQVSGKGDVIIKGIQHTHTRLNEQAKPKDLIALEDSLESVSISIEKNIAKRDGLTEEQNMILANKMIGGQQNGVKAIELEDISEFVRERITAIKSELVDIRVKERKLNELKSKIQQQINEKYQNRNAVTSEITIEVQAKTNTTADLEISYYVNNAGWTPLYDIRAVDGKKAIQIMMKANVFQNTGFDWRNAKITLSTGNPTLGGTKPQLSPWFLSIYTPVVYQAKKSRAMGGAEKSMAPSYPPIVEAPDVEEASALSISDFITSVENNIRLDYKIEIPYSIPSDGKQHAIDVQSNDINANYLHYAVPKLDNDAFLVAQITDWDNLNLLSGNANVYYDGSFVGETYLDTQNADDTLNISLGRDKRVIISRTQVKDKTSKKLIGTNRTETKAFEISIRNTRKDAIELILEDQIPISKTSEIEVELTDRGGANYNAETGKLTWNYKIDPSDTKKTRFAFTAKYPKDKKVSGL